MQRPVLLAHPGVASVDARRDGSEGKTRVELGGQVLQGVDGEVDAAAGERLLDLLDEDALAIGQRRKGGQAIGVRVGTLGRRGACMRSPVVRMISISTVWPRAAELRRRCGSPCQEGELGTSRTDADGFSHSLLQRTVKGGGSVLSGGGICPAGGTSPSPRI